MKALIINASPHRQGESFRISEEVLSFIHATQLEAEAISLIDLDIKQCLACYSCFPRGEEHCPLKDERETIERKMLESDALLLISPVYSEQVPALLKNWIDRMAYLIHRPRFFAKTALVLTQSSGSGLKESAGYLKKILSYWGYQQVDTLQLPVPMGGRSERYTRWREKLLSKALKRFQARMGKKRYRPSFLQVGFYGAWKRIAELTKEINPADYDYWESRGWLQRGRNYFTGQRIGPLKWLVSRMARAFTGGFLRRKLWKE